MTTQNAPVSTTSDDDGDNGSDSGSGLVEALQAAGGTPLQSGSPLENSFGNAFNELKTEQSTTGLGSRNGGNYSYLPDLGGPAAKVNVTQNMQTAVDFFTAQKRPDGQNWTQAQAVGIVANLYAESALNPSIHGDHGLAYGIGQWHPDRQAEFQRQIGRPIQGSSLEQQLVFVNYELTQGGERNAGVKLQGAEDARSAAATISRYYERPGDVLGEMKHRAGIADGIVAHLDGVIPRNNNHPSLAVDASRNLSNSGHIVVMGDSLGQGMGNALASKGFDVNNQAIVGSGLYGQQNVDWIAKSNTLAQSMHAGDHLIVMMGRNDVGYPTETLEARTNQLMTNLKLAKERGVDVTIVSPTYAGDKDAANVQRVADVFQRAAQQNGLSYIDINQSGALAHGSDGIHLGSNGYSQLADRVITGAGLGQNQQVATNTGSRVFNKISHLFGIGA